LANPAQRIRPFKFGPEEAARAIASGVEKDSAKRTYGSARGETDWTSCCSSEYDKVLSEGYLTIVASISSGRSLAKAVKSAPVPSMPGNSMSFIGEGGINIILAGSFFWLSRLCGVEKTAPGLKPLFYGSFSGPKRPLLPPGSRFRANAHLSDDKTVAKMGHPALSIMMRFWWAAIFSEC